MLPSETINLLYVVLFPISALAAYLVPKLLEPILTSKGPRPAKRGFPWLWWLLAHAIAGGVGGAFSFSFRFRVIVYDLPGEFGYWPAVGACLGIAQWLVLQRERPLTPLWAVASTMGWSTYPVIEGLGLHAFPSMIVAILAVGVLQWPILAGRRVRAVWWVPANFAAWFVGLSIGSFAWWDMLESSLPSLSAWVLGWSIVGLVGSCITGFALSRLPQRETRKQ